MSVVASDTTTALGAAAATGIHRIPLPTPFAVGDVHAYLIDDDPVVLVDCGPDHGTSLVALEDGLAALGRSLTDIDVLLLTHPHIDHFGCASVVAARSGAKVWCLDAGADVVEDWKDYAERTDAWICDQLVEHGVPQAVALAAHSASILHARWAAPARVDRRLRAREVLHLRDRALEVLHLPGHSPWDTALLDADARVLLGGDHLLASTASNALMTPEADGSRRRALLQYRASLLRTRALDVEVVLGGHGEPVTGHVGLIDERLAAQDRRATKLAERLDGGQKSVHELATELWGTTALQQVYATTSEVLGHLDLLDNRRNGSCS